MPVINLGLPQAHRHLQEHMCPHMQAHIHIRMHTHAPLLYTHKKITQNNVWLTSGYLLMQSDCCIKLTVVSHIVLNLKACQWLPNTMPGIVMRYFAHIIKVPNPLSIMIDISAFKYVLELKSKIQRRTELHKPKLVTNRKIEPQVTGKQEMSVWTRRNVKGYRLYYAPNHQGSLWFNFMTSIHKGT